MSATLSIDTREFKQALSAYMRYSRKALPEILNTKGFMIARNALLATPKADAAEIRSLKRMDNMPRAVAILKQRLESQGKELPTKKREIRKAVVAMVGKRIKAITYMKSGWLPAIKGLARFIDPKYRGKEKTAIRKAKAASKKSGDYYAAREGWFCRTIIINKAQSKDDKRNGLERYGMPALREAFDKEVGSMSSYVMSKMAREARRAGIKADAASAIVTP